MSKATRAQHGPSCTRLDGAEALSVLVNHFAECIETGAKPITSAESGLHIVKMMEAATESMKHNGREILLD